MRIATGLCEAIGKTPLLHLKHISEQLAGGATILAKAE